jgi:hypothetical protein
MQIAVLLTVCEGEYEIARYACMSVLRSTPGHTCWFQIVDDGSPSQVGHRLLDQLRDSDAEGHVHRLGFSLGFRGCAQRTCEGLNQIARSGRSFDIVLKLDPDTLIIGGQQLGQFLDQYCCNPAEMWGSLHTMRKRDRVLFAADFLPLGFRRKAKGYVLTRQWELGRFRPVWWFRFGWRAVTSGRFRFRHPGGGFYILAADLVRKMHARGYLDSIYQGRHGFVSSEEDLIATMLCLAVGGRIRNFEEVRPGFAQLGYRTVSGGQSATNLNHVVIHPIKDTPDGQACRAALLGSVQAELPPCDRACPATSEPRAKTA